MNKLIIFIKKLITKQVIIFSLICTAAIGSTIFQYMNATSLTNNLTILSSEKIKIERQLSELKNQDQYKRNEILEAEIKSINTTYTSSLTTYEKIQDLKAQKQNTDDLDKAYAQVLSDLSKRNYASAQASLISLAKSVDQKTASIAAIASTPQSSAIVSNSLPSNGFSSQQVKTDRGTFLVSIVAADLNSTRVVVDTASDGDCSNNCPALPLATYVSRSNAFAGINGTFFCPPEYPTCAGKTNSFDTLLLNKNKHYFNSDNNKYSTVPLIYFSGSSAGIRGQSLDWGRDTSVDSVIANHPLYVAGSKNQFGGSSDPKITSKGARTFIGNKGSFAYMGIVYNASAEDAALVLATLQLDNALGLDQGGSTALWHSGYKAGPGRNIPNAVLFIRK